MSSTPASTIKIELKLVYIDKRQSVLWNGIGLTIKLYTETLALIVNIFDMSIFELFCMEDVPKCCTKFLKMTSNI